MTQDHTRVAHGGKSVYGARLGILMLEARFPRIPGDMGNGETWPFPVMFRVVPGASPDRVVRRGATGLLDAFKEAALDLVRLGCDGITTNCGFLSIYQKELARHVGVPVATSSLLQIPVVQSLLPPGRRVGVLTVNAATLTPAHFEAIDVDPRTPVVGAEGRREFTRVLIDDEARLDVALAEQDILDAGRELVNRHPDVGAVVLECTNMCPYAAALQAALRLPVYDVYAFMVWFHAGLRPRDFGPPGSGPRVWRER